MDASFFFVPTNLPYALFNIGRREPLTDSLDSISSLVCITTALLVVQSGYSGILNGIMFCAIGITTGITSAFL